MPLDWYGLMVMLHRLLCVRQTCFYYTKPAESGAHGGSCTPTISALSTRRLCWLGYVGEKLDPETGLVTRMFRFERECL